MKNEYNTVAKAITIKYGSCKRARPDEDGGVSLVVLEHNVDFKILHLPILW